MFAPTARILVVDDMSSMRKLVIKALKQFGFSDFTEAGDGAVAWQAFSSATPPIELIISDWNMPTSTGLDLLKRVRAESRFKSTPFILLTAESEKSQVAEALKNGVSGYIVKPYTPEALKEQIEKVSKTAA